MCLSLTYGGVPTPLSHHGPYNSCVLRRRCSRSSGPCVRPVVPKDASGRVPCRGAYRRRGIGGRECREETERRSPIQPSVSTGLGPGPLLRGPVRPFSGFREVRAGVLPGPEAPARVAQTVEEPSSVPVVGPPDEHVVS